ncbi:MAG: hypothetical protein H7X80_11010, partial [bacterium]|nr:hypothetical protein [Candidatus Kapabacteria bacterium]
MMLRYVLQTASIILLCVITSPVSAQQTNPTANAIHSLSNSPVAFIPNRGQIADSRGDRRPDILYPASSHNTQVYVRAGAISYVFQRRAANVDVHDESDDHHEGHREGSGTVDYYRMDVELVGARQRVDVVEEDITDGVRHYYLGHCADGILNVPAFGKVTLKDVYPKIDMVLRSSDQGMKCDFVVRPGGRPSDIRMRYVGATSVQRAVDGSLLAATPLGDVLESAPVTYQTIGASRRDVESHFRVNGDVVSFDIGSYDRTRTLVI